MSLGGGVGSSSGDCKAQLFLVPELQVEMPESHGGGGGGGLGDTAGAACVPQQFLRGSPSAPKEHGMPSSWLGNSPCWHQD